VTIVAPRLLPRDDPEAANTLRRVFEREGIRLIVGRATSVHRDARAIVVTSDREETRGDCLLVAAGRKPNVHGLALERAGVVYSDRGIPVDDRLRTNVRHIYAAGDVLGSEQFSHIAGWQAFAATRNALLPGSASGRPNPIAWVTFTDPEVAQIGLTERQARDRFGDPVKVVRWELGRVDRAACDDEEDGFMKIVTGKNDAIVGATIVASRAGEMSGEMSLAVARQLTIGQIATAIHAYPTYATAIQQMASELATANWVSSSQGRIVTRLVGLASRGRPLGGRIHAEDQR
jgi:pyruvate/2-oxoglutarate dehydrogenase complex dihydrolipoamide dehydrogenase (E3) component